MSASMLRGVPLTTIRPLAVSLAFPSVSQAAPTHRTQTQLRRNNPRTTRFNLVTRSYPLQFQASYSDMTEEMAEPTGLIAKSGIELLTFGTPNGFKISILLEELKEAYGLDYTVQMVDISKGTQKEPWYTALNPNGRIPTIVDHDRGDFAVFEGSAILAYLTRHYDPDHRFSFPVDSDDHSVAEQWIAWQHGGLGPMQGQANHFLRFSRDRIPYAAQRYVGETERLYGILDARLSDRDFVAGPGPRGKYSIADMALVGWVNLSRFSAIDLPGMFPSVQRWYDRLQERPAVRRGFTVPRPARFGNAAFEKQLADGEEGMREREEELERFVDYSKKQYNYKYASP